MTVFGAGAMGTAFAMHSARAGLPTSLWANEHDLAAYAAMREERKHPLLPEHLPDGVELRGPNELEAAARDVEIAVLAANSAGARSLASMVREQSRALASPSPSPRDSNRDRQRMSEVYGEELSGVDVVVVGGPCLARELAEGLPTAGRLGRERRVGRRGRGQAVRRPSLSALLLRRRRSASSSAR